MLLRVEGAQLLRNCLASVLGVKWQVTLEEVKPPSPNQGDLESYDLRTQQPHESTFTLQQIGLSLCAAAKI